MTPENKQRADHLNLLEVVEDLGEETKDLALNLALYLAKAKAKSNPEQLSRLEPDFIRLVNGAVKVIQELTVILDAARDRETTVYEVPSGKVKQDQMEVRLEAIVQQCNQILASLSQAKDLIA